MLTPEQEILMGYSQDEQNRMDLVRCLSSECSEESEEESRKRLAEIWVTVWDTEELQKDFEVLGFCAPFCIVLRKKDDCFGWVLFQHSPRFYFGFEAGERPQL